MRLPLIAGAAALATVACSSAVDPDAATLVQFTYNTAVPTTQDVLYDSVAVAARVMTITRKSLGNLCGSRLTSGMSNAGSELTLNVIQSPIAACADPAQVITYRGDVQLPPGAYHLRVVERNGVNPAGAVVIDRTVIIPTVD